MWVSLGWAQRAFGEFVAAEPSFRRALELNPGRTAAHWNLAVTSRQTGGGEEVERLQQILMLPDMPELDRLAAGFSLGKIFDDADRYRVRYYRRLEPCLSMPG